MFSKLLGLALWSLVAVAAGLALERGVVGTYQKWFALNGGSLGESSALSPRQLFWCDFGDTPCGDGCMPLGDVCCGIINPGYCLKGYTCLDNGCCPIGELCVGSPKPCPAGEEPCGHGCMIAGRVCCPNGFSCSSSQKCTSDGHCADKGVLTLSLSITSTTATSSSVGSTQLSSIATQSTALLSSTMKTTSALKSTSSAVSLQASTSIKATQTGPKMNSTTAIQT